MMTSIELASEFIGPRALHSTTLNNGLTELAQSLSLRRYSADRAVDPEIAAGVADLFKTQYADRYPNPDMYSAERICNLISQGNITLYTLCNNDSKVVAVAALIQLEPGVYEVGKIIVHPDLRSHGIGHSLTERVVDIAAFEGASAIYAWAFTAHPYSQRIFHALGFNPCGVTVRDWVDAFDTGYRESAVVMSYFPDQKVKQMREVHCPQPLRGLVASIFSDIGCQREFAEPLVHTVSIETDFELSDPIIPPTGAVTIDLDDKIAVNKLLPVFDQLNQKGARHISVSMNMQSPSTHNQTLDLMAAGFRFAAVQPGPERDLLVLQRCESVPSANEYELNFAQNSSLKIFQAIVE